ncbi:MAG TPA: exodeoxyribonuclease VII small subunit [Rhodanobacteraceae bacterium]
MSKPKNNPATASDNNQIADFENSLSELESLVNKLEGGELSLDESLKSFERGITLFRNCQGALQQAELRVQTLLDPENPDSATPLPDTDED